MELPRAQHVLQPKRQGSDVSNVHAEARLTIVVTVDNLKCVRVLLQGAVEQHAVLRQVLKGLLGDDAVACCGGKRCEAGQVIAVCGVCIMQQPFVISPKDSRRTLLVVLAHNAVHLLVSEPVLPAETETLSALSLPAGMQQKHKVHERFLPRQVRPCRLRSPQAGP
jgi:hypothetical protein